MGSHINEAGQFQSDKYPTCPPGKVPLSVKDATAQPLLWAYAQIRRSVDAEFSNDLENALLAAGYKPRAGENNMIRLAFDAGVGAAARLVENHSCVSSCCDAQPSGGEARELAECIRRNAQ